MVLDVKKHDEKQIRELFARIDVSGNGLIEEEELRDLCEDLDVPESQFKDLFKRIDANDDGVVDLDDFTKGFSLIAKLLENKSEEGTAKDTFKDFQKLEDSWRKFKESKLTIPNTNKFILSPDQLKLCYDMYMDMGLNSAKGKKGGNVATKQLEDLVGELADALINNAEALGSKSSSISQNLNDPDNESGNIRKSRSRNRHGRSPHHQPSQSTEVIKEITREKIVSDVRDSKSSDFLDKHSRHEARDHSPPDQHEMSRQNWHKSTTSLVSEEGLEPRKRTPGLAMPSGGKLKRPHSRDFLNLSNQLLNRSSHNIPGKENDPPGYNRSPRSSLGDAEKQIIEKITRELKNRRKPPPNNHLISDDSDINKHPDYNIRKRDNRIPTPNRFKGSYASLPPGENYPFIGSHDDLKNLIDKLVEDKPEMNQRMPSTGRNRSPYLDEKKRKKPHSSKRNRRKHHKDRSSSYSRSPSVDYKSRKPSSRRKNRSRDRSQSPHKKDNIRSRKDRDWSQNSRYSSASQNSTSDSADESSSRDRETKRRRHHPSYSSDSSLTDPSTGRYPGERNKKYHSKDSERFPKNRKDRKSHSRKPHSKRSRSRSNRHNESDSDNYSSDDAKPRRNKRESKNRRNKKNASRDNNRRQKTRNPQKSKSRKKRNVRSPSSTTSLDKEVIRNNKINYHSDSEFTDYHARQSRRPSSNTRRKRSKPRSGSEDTATRRKRDKKRPNRGKFNPKHSDGSDVEFEDYPKKSRNNHRKKSVPRSSSESSGLRRNSKNPILRGRSKSPGLGESMKERDPRYPLEDWRSHNPHEKVFSPVKKKLYGSMPVIYSPTEFNHPKQHSKQNDLSGDNPGRNNSVDSQIRQLQNQIDDLKKERDKLKDQQNWEIPEKPSNIPTGNDHNDQASMLADVVRLCLQFFTEREFPAKPEVDHPEMHPTDVPTFFKETNPNPVLCHKCSDSPPTHEPLTCEKCDSKLPSRPKLPKEVQFDEIPDPPLRSDPQPPSTPCPTCMTPMPEDTFLENKNQTEPSVYPTVTPTMRDSFTQSDQLNRDSKVSVKPTSIPKELVNKGIQFDGISEVSTQTEKIPDEEPHKPQNSNDKLPIEVTSKNISTQYEAPLEMKSEEIQTEDTNLNIPEMIVGETQTKTNPSNLMVEEENQTDIKPVIHDETTQTESPSKDPSEESCSPVEEEESKLSLEIEEPMLATLEVQTDETRIQNPDNILLAHPAKDVIDEDQTPSDTIKEIDRKAGHADDAEGIPLKINEEIKETPTETPPPSREEGGSKEDYQPPALEVQPLIRKLSLMSSPTSESELGIQDENEDFSTQRFPIIIPTPAPSVFSELEEMDSHHSIPIEVIVRTTDNQDDADSIISEDIDLHSIPSSFESNDKNGIRELSPAVKQSVTESEPSIERLADSGILPDVIPNADDQSVLDESITDNFESIQKLPPTRAFKIVVCGDEGVGKTAFVHRVAHELYDFDNVENESTVEWETHNVKMLINGEICLLNIWDLSGKEEYRPKHEPIFRKADGVIIMYDITNPESFKHVKDWMKLAKDLTDRGALFLVIGHKYDILDRIALDDTAESMVDNKKAYNFAQKNGAAFIEVSSKTKQYLDSSIGPLLINRLCVHQDIDMERIELQVSENKRKRNQTGRCTVM